MRIADMNWQQVEQYLGKDDRCVLPLGCTEQHAFLSLATDSILAERMSIEAAEPIGVPVFPVIPVGMTPSFMSYPGTVSIGLETYARLLRDVLESVTIHGFRRILIVNGHGGNTPARAAVTEWAGAKPDVRLIWHDWWNAPKTMTKVTEIDADASHASWMENFPWTRLEGVEMPSTNKPLVDYVKMRQLKPREVRQFLGDGNYGGRYQRSDEEMLAIWEIAVQETRHLLEAGWA